MTVCITFIKLAQSVQFYIIVILHFVENNIIFIA